jgi:hypothetical protein
VKQNELERMRRLREEESKEESEAEAERRLKEAEAERRLKEVERRLKEVEVELERMRRLREAESPQIQAGYTELQPDLRLREEESPATPFCELEIHVKDTEAEESPDEIHVKDTEAEAERRLKEEESMAESHDEIHVDVNDTEQQRLTEEEYRAVIEDNIFREEWDGCICIPLRETDEDEWTKLLIRFMRSKDKEGRGVRVFAADAMEKYIDWSGESVSVSVTTDIITEYYTGFSLLVQRLIEVIVNFLLTGWLRVDGFCSAVEIILLIILKGV